MIRLGNAMRAGTGHKKTRPKQKKLNKDSRSADVKYEVAIQVSVEGKSAHKLPQDLCGMAKHPKKDCQKRKHDQLSNTSLDQQQFTKLSLHSPSLAGQPLEPPQFLKTNWKLWQTFSENEDPDRIRLPWELPGFVLCKDPLLQRTRTTVEELELPTAKPPVVRERWSSDCEFARVVRKVLSEEDCLQLIGLVNDRKFTPALLNIGEGWQQFRPEIRDGARVIVDSPELAAWLFEVLRPYLPQQLQDGSRLIGLNERLRFLCYTPGQFFAEHQDGCYVRPNGHPRAGDWSHITVQLYLHDIPVEFGGATTFFSDYHVEQNSVKYQPEAGSVLLFTQDLVHEGSLVHQGVKYAMRTEVMYSASHTAVQT